MNLIDKAQDAEYSLYMYLAPLIIVSLIIGFFFYEPPKKVIKYTKPKPPPTKFEKAGEWIGDKTAETGKGFFKGVVREIFK